MRILERHCIQGEGSPLVVASRTVMWGLSMAGFDTPLSGKGLYPNSEDAKPGI